MANRHLLRSIAMQSLFEWDFRGKDEKKIEEIIKKAGYTANLNT